MSRIDDPASRPAIAGRSGADGVDKTNRALTAQLDGQSVDTDMAPMLAELLTRPEELRGDRGPEELGPPSPRGNLDPPSPTGQLRALRRVEGKLDQAVAECDDPGRAEAVQTMRQTVEMYRGLREEVVMRAEM